MCKTVECPECGHGIKIAGSDSAPTGGRVRLWVDGVEVTAPHVTTASTLGWTSPKPAPQVTCLGDCQAADCANHLSGRCG